MFKKHFLLSLLLLSMLKPDKNFVETVIHFSEFFDEYCHKSFVSLSMDLYFDILILPAFSSCGFSSCLLDWHCLIV